MGSSPRQVDRVVNKTRRRSSLLTTVTTVDASVDRISSRSPSAVAELRVGYAFSVRGVLKRMRILQDFI